MHCAKCGVAIPEGAAFCPGCGTPQDLAPPLSSNPQIVNAPPVDRKPLGCLGVGAIVVFVLIIMASIGNRSTGNSSSTALPIESKAATRGDAQLKECARLIKVGQASGVILGRPDGRRIDVDEMMWTALSADAKRGMLAALRCDAYQGQAGALDEAVAYGYHSGKRLAMITSVGVTFD